MTIENIHLLFGLSHFFDFRVHPVVGPMSKHVVLHSSVAGLAQEARPAEKCSMLTDRYNFEFDQLDKGAVVVLYC